MQIRGLSNDANQAGDTRRLRHESKTGDPVGSGRSYPNDEIRSESALDRSPEIARLAATLRRTPDVRKDVLARAAARLSSGYYLTQEAAEETADRLMS